MTDLSGLTSFSGMADIHGLRRILDNLISNVEKYADPEHEVELTLKTEDRRLILTQRNLIRESSFGSVESSRIGLENIRRIAALYNGQVDVSDAGGVFEIRIVLSIPECL